MLHYFPQFFTKKAIVLYFLSIGIMSLVFMQYSMSMLWIVFGIVEVVGFFFFANTLTKSWAGYSEKKFTKKLFWISFIIRIVWVVVSYYMYLAMTGQPFEFEAIDVLLYDRFGRFGAEHFREGDFNIAKMFYDLPLSDRGYPTYLSFVYWLTGDSIVVTRLLKALLGAVMCLLIYRLATRNFGEKVGRVAAIICMLFPNLIYYCGLHLKEIEMLFLIVLALDRADLTIRSKDFSVKNIVIMSLSILALFAFRTVIGAVLVLSIIATVVLTSGRVSKLWKRIAFGFFAGIILFFGVGNMIMDNVREVWDARDTNQDISMEWRSKLKGGNKYAKYGSVALFAPAIFVIPIPTMVDIETQQNHQMIHGGFFVKNILSFFLYVSLIVVVFIKKNWREFVLLGSFMLGYLAVISMSSFAAAERFHLPIVPIYMMFVAYGIGHINNKNKKYFQPYLIFLFAIFIAWNYIKLSGRGLV